MAYGILYDYLMGQSIDAFKYFGAHFGYIDIERDQVVPPKKPGGKPKTVQRLGRQDPQDEQSGSLWRL